MGIFNKTSMVDGKNPTDDGKTESQLFKYPKPKILLLDLPRSASLALSEIGFNVNVGSFGKPYKVQKSSNYQPLIGLRTLPNHSEQEIVVIDLFVGDKANATVGERHRPEDEPDIWAKCDQGFIDPRPRTAHYVIESFDRILSSGGVFVVFADAKTGVDLSIARMDKLWNRLEIDGPFPFDVWNFISEFADMSVSEGHGYEMSVKGNGSSLRRLVSEYLKGSEFTCTLEGGYRDANAWETIAENKFGHAVALSRHLENGGSIIVLPQLANKAEFLIKLFKNILPEIAPHLFPSIERGRWTHLPEYELAKILESKAKQIEIEKKAITEIANLEAEVNVEQIKNGWVHDLLTGTGDQLVEAVKMALAELGFKDVIDVDEDRDREGKSRREDLQIHDLSPWLIVDVKGIGGSPSDEDALQAGKHAMIRMRELKRTDINGLSIINHQRHLPPLDRGNSMPFRQELIDAALEQSLGLMTTWDLYRLVINSRKYCWHAADVKPLFYESGRVEIIPQHYQYIGTVAKVWTDKFGVILEEGELNVCDRIAIEFSIEFEEVAVNSILINGKSVEQAKVSDQTGILWPEGKPKLRDGLRVFRVLKKIGSQK